MDTFKSLATKFMAGSLGINPAVKIAIKKGAIIVRDDAKKKFGKYQPAVGPFPAWENLAAGTIEQKSKAGGKEDPLIGHYRGKAHNKVWPAPLRNTIEIDCDGLTAFIGTADKLGSIHEYGCGGSSEKHGPAGRQHNVIIPPRPFLRPAMYENAERVRDEIALAIGETIKKM